MSNHAPARSYDIPLGHIILAAGQPVCALNYVPFICRPFDKGASTANLKYLVWLGREANPYTSNHIPILVRPINYIFQYLVIHLYLYTEGGLDF